jgi:hypothetical protein
MGCDLSVEQVAVFEPPSDVGRRPDDQVQGEWRWDRQPDFERLVKLVASRHDHQNVDVAAGVRSAVGVRPE